MKNVIIFMLLLVSLVAGYFAIYGRWRLSLAGIEGTIAKITRGDLTLPINATGEVKPARRVEIKAEASGEVIEITKQAGQRVNRGELLIRLEPDEEERSVIRAQSDLAIAEARLKTIQTNLTQAQTTDLTNALAQVVQLEEQLKLSKFQKEKFENLPEHQRSEEETLQRDTTLRRQEAQLDSARADVEARRLAILRAEQEVKQFEAAYETAKNNLADAAKRLAKTDILAPLDGIVGDIRVQIGEVIQGGKTTYTGGTLLAVVLDVGRLVVKAEVDESDVGRVLAIAPAWAIPGSDAAIQRPADPASAMEHLPTITVESFRDREFKGYIERVYPEAEKLKGVVTYLVDVVITSDTDVLLPGMRADVSFTSDHVADAVLCPNEAIREGPQGRLGVYVPKANSPPQQRETEFVACKFGLDNGNYSQVLCDELKEGMAVYTRLPAKRDEESGRKKRKD